MPIDSLITEFLSGSRRALAKAITEVENETEMVSELFNTIYPKVGHAYRIGITGPPGAGKSTLVDQLTKQLRSHDYTVGIIAVDPTSPFTGGALLGDRVRMVDVVTDPGVFIRSMATRGSLGGLSQKAQEAGDVLDAFGKDFILFETVGVGQSELDIVETADTVIVILVPEGGDSVQAMKAGLMEIADIFVMNKSDREGATRARHELEGILHLRPAAAWNPPVVATVASEGRGIAEVWEEIRRHRAHIGQAGRLLEKRKRRFEKSVRTLVRYQLEQKFWNDQAERYLRERVEDFQNTRISPYDLAEKLVADYCETEGNETCIAYQSE